MKTFRKGDKIKSPAGSIGIILKRRENQYLVFWECNLKPYTNANFLQKPSTWGGWEDSHVWNGTELRSCKKIGRTDFKRYNNMKILFGTKNEI